MTESGGRVPGWCLRSSVFKHAPVLHNEWPVPSRRRLSRNVDGAGWSAGWADGMHRDTQMTGAARYEAVSRVTRRPVTREGKDSKTRTRSLECPRLGGGARMRSLGSPRLGGGDRRMMSEYLGRDAMWGTGVLTSPVYTIRLSPLPVNGRAFEWEFESLKRVLNGAATRIAASSIIPISSLTAD